MLAIVTSHPIQYQAPLWRALAADGRVPFEVWFLTPHAIRPSLDREFGQAFAWDLDLLSGYPNRFLEIEPEWNLDRFDGIHLRRAWRDEFRMRKVTALWIEGWRFRVLWQAVAAARGLGIPVFLRGESHGLAPEPFWKRWTKRAALGWLFGRIDHFLCIGSANRRFYLTHGVPAERLVSAPYCVDNQRFAIAAAELRSRRPEFRQKWNIPQGAWCALFCGKLIPKKRPLDLVEASRLSPRVADRPLHLLFAGDGALASTIRTSLSESGTPGGTITGFLNQTQIPAAFAAADCLILPSDYGETWGLVANEALASGLPVIVSDHCGCAPDLAAPLGPFHVFPCGNPSALAIALTQVAAHPPANALIAQLSETHSPQRTVETVTKLYLPSPHPRS